MYVITTVTILVAVILAHRDQFLISFDKGCESQVSEAIATHYTCTHAAHAYYSNNMRISNGTHGVSCSMHTMHSSTTLTVCIMHKSTKSSIFFAPSTITITNPKGVWMRVWLIVNVCD